jgi:SAM-dependent methyltransferase
MNEVQNEKKLAYWRYQYRLGKEYLIPLLHEWGFSTRDILVIDLGCAEAGILCAFAEEGAKGIGLEISHSRLVFARHYANPRHLQKLRLIAADIFHPALSQKTPRADLLLLRDVFEHLPDKEYALRSFHNLLGESSKLLITFPPFYAPFGGHQQLLTSFLGKLPYFHIVPAFLWQIFRWWIIRYDKNPGILPELERIRHFRTTIGGFKKIIQENGFRIVRSAFYISRPSYKLRFGWPIIRANGLGRIPFVREFLISGAFFLLEKTK